MISISVIIATHGRNDLLLHRSLKSVYEQSYHKNVDVVICVDENDSEIDSVINGLKVEISAFRKHFHIRKFQTKVIPNKRTKFHSGTGAWNTAILSVINLKKLDKNREHFIAILDDDDSWDKDYLDRVVKYCSPNTGMVVSGIKYIDSEGSCKVLLANELKKEKIYVKNPGIFGSNMFINLDAFLSAGGFDESMRSSTDRDFLMRYAELEGNSCYMTKFCNFALVNHYADKNRKRVTNDKFAKKQGLDVFYYKYQNFGDDFTLKEKSLERAKKLFGYDSIGIDFFEREKTLPSENLLYIPTAKVNVIIGIICFELINLKRFLKSVLNIKDSPYLDRLIIYVFSNFECNDKFSKELELHDIKVVLDCNRMGIDSIAKNRTNLKRKIYDFIGSEDFIVWILDDDLEFYQKDYFREIALMRENEDADLLFSPITNEPPLPFLLTLRRNFTEYFFVRDNADRKIDRIDQQFLSEFYYDLTEDFRYLELPASNKNRTSDQILEHIKKGQSAYKIDFFEEHFGKILPGKNPAIVGGNCIVLNKKYLLIPNFTPDEETYNRRSDFNWSILCLKNKANIKRTYLPLKHIRDTPFNLADEIQKLEKDLLGNRFYRIFYEIVVHEKSFKEIQSEYSVMIKEFKQKLYFNLRRISFFASMISDPEVKKIVDAYEKTIRKICKKRIVFSRITFNRVKKLLSANWQDLK